MNFYALLDLLTGPFIVFSQNTVLWLSFMYTLLVWEFSTYLTFWQFAAQLQKLKSGPDFGSKAELGLSSCHSINFQVKGRAATILLNEEQRMGKYWSSLWPLCSPAGCSSCSNRLRRATLRGPPAAKPQPSPSTARHHCFSCSSAAICGQQMKDGLKWA